jgi:anhydro-N-acetylmuramic acid kinase
MVVVIGLMSGTSVDGIDAALVNIEGKESDLKISLLVGETYSYPEALRKEILEVCGGKPLSLETFAELDDAIAFQFALAAQKIQQGQIQAELIGSHGQTVYHRPPQQNNLGYTIQIGRGEAIANLTGIKTVSNFRAADIAARGQGAPLVSKIDACLLSHPSKNRIVQNIGGIANLTYLPARQELNWEDKICGWDTGPGNALIDLAVQKLTSGAQTYDRDGNWASQGVPCEPLVQKWLEQDFFAQTPPKSTGRELFGESYLLNCWEEARAAQLNDADLLATIVELTVASIARSYRDFLPSMPEEVLLCGGGSRNLYLKQRLQSKLNNISRVLTTDEAGLNGDFKEAIAFAVLAYWRYYCSVSGNLPQVTGAKKAVPLGDIHIPIDLSLLT